MAVTRGSSNNICDDGEDDFLDGWHIAFYHQVPQASVMDPNQANRLREVNPHITESTLVLVDQMLREAREEGKAREEAILSAAQARENRLLDIIDKMTARPPAPAQPLSPTYQVAESVNEEQQAPSAAQPAALALPRRHPLPLPRRHPPRSPP